MIEPKYICVYVWTVHDDDPLRGTPYSPVAAAVAAVLKQPFPKHITPRGRGGFPSSEEYCHVHDCGSVAQEKASSPL